ncbi:hypothetical protein [Rossellomorea marisflavi]
MEIFQIGIAEEQPTNEEIINIAKVLQGHNFISTKEFKEIEIEVNSK